MRVSNPRFCPQCRAFAPMFYHGDTSFLVCPVCGQDAGQDHAMFLEKVRRLKAQRDAEDEPIPGGLTEQERATSERLLRLALEG